MTLFTLLGEGTAALEQAGISDAALDAKLLLMQAFELDQVHVLMNRMQELDENDQVLLGKCHRFSELIARRASHKPLQQITGTAGFMGMDFYVNEHVLIPRQDTETLVELVLAECPDTELDVLDVCTGSGCIAISLAVMGHYRQVTGTDISAEALKVANCNRDSLVTEEPSRVKFLQGDLFEAVPDGERYDVITSNPPYIPTAVVMGLEPEVRDHEPMLALDGTEDGLYFYRKIVAAASQYLKPGGQIYFEIGHDQGQSVSQLLIDAGYIGVRVIKDLPGNDRVVTAKIRNERCN